MSRVGDSGEKDGGNGVREKKQQNFTNNMNNKYIINYQKIKSSSYSDITATIAVEIDKGNRQKVYIFNKFNPIIIIMVICVLENILCIFLCNASFFFHQFLFLSHILLSYRNVY